MKRTTKSLALALPPALALAAASAALGCSAIPIKLNTRTTVRHADGTVEHHETHWQGTLDQLPAQLGKFGDELGSVTAKLATELTAVPPPGKITLGDLHPSLAKYQGKTDMDFVAQAKDGDGAPIPFTYVRLGVPSYDDFFKTAQQSYALVYQTDQTVHRMREVVSKRLGAGVDTSSLLRASVD